MIDTLEVKNDFAISKHNEFIKIYQVKRQMTLIQCRIFDSIIATIQYLVKNKKIDLASDLQEDRIIRIDYDLFYSCLLDGTSAKKLNKKDIAQGLDDLVTMSFQWDNEDGYGSASIFTRAEVNTTTNEVIIRLGKDFNQARVIPQNGYTRLLCGNLNTFRSQYSRILYQYFKMYLGSNPDRSFKNSITFCIEDIHRIFSINKKEHSSYIEQPNILVRRCIKEPIEEINANPYSDINIYYEIIKSGRKINKIKFNFYLKKVNYDSDYIGMDFVKFKKDIVEKYCGKMVIQAVKGYNPEITFSLNEKNLLVNDFSNKILSSDEAYEVWNFMYKNQSMIGILFSPKEIFLLNYKLKKLKLDTTDNLFTLIDIEEQEQEQYTVVFKNKDGQICRSSNTYTITQLKEFQWL